MTYALFLGCTIPARGLDYELSARKVTSLLGVDIRDREFSCCGFPLEAVDEEKALLLASRNLAVAEAAGNDILVLCSACAETLTKTILTLEDQKTLSRVNESLHEEFGLKYEGKLKVRHLARFLHEEIGPEKLKSLVTRPLTGLKVAVHYGCHYMRPSRVYKGFDDPLRPRSLDELVELTGAQSLGYENKMACCGGEVLSIDEKIAVEMASQKLKPLSTAAVDALVVICPFCSIMYSRYQRTVLSDGREIPVIYYSQLLGLAMGLEPDELGFGMSVMDVSELLSKVVQK